MTGYFRALFIQLQHIAGGEDENIFFFISKLFGYFFLRNQMLVFAVNGNRIFRTHKRIDQLNVFLTGVPGYVGVLKDHIRPFHKQLIDDI